MIRFVPLVRWVWSDLPPGRERGPFNTSIHRTLVELDYEVEQLRLASDPPSLITVAVDVDQSDIRDDEKMLRANTRTRTPRVVVSFDSRHGQLVFAADRYTTGRAFPGWSHNLRSVAVTLSALRDVGRWGVSSGQQYSGWTPAAIEQGDRR